MSNPMIQVGDAVREMTADEHAQYLIDTSPPALVDVQADAVTKIKADAEARILAIMPEFKQRNTLALAAEAITTHGPDPTLWPQDLQDANTVATAAWTAIKAIRAHSDALEIQIAAAGTPADVDTILANPGWPA
ncbi:MAG: hypothetical protein JJ902_05500 [Roseibium sp.]|nr:hypothetical protein [Roseibium sp.]